MNRPGKIEDMYVQAAENFPGIVLGRERTVERAFAAVNRMAVLLRDKYQL
jgi:hypothetical protein